MEGVLAGSGRGQLMLGAPMPDWWKDFFDADYIRLWDSFTAERTATEADGLWQVLELYDGSRVLDAPCGYGRLSRPLAERGAVVLGVDQSEALLQHAEGERGDLRAVQLRYKRHDLREPLGEKGFDAAINIFSSLGYGSEEDDLAILRNLRAALRPGARVGIIDRDGDGTDHGVNKSIVLHEADEAGYRLLAEHDDLVKEDHVDYFLVLAVK